MSKKKIEDVVLDYDKKALKRRTQEAETTLAEIMLEQAQIELKRDQLRFKEFEKELRFDMNQGRHVGVFNLEGTVGNSAVKLAEELQTYGRAYPGKPITLNIFSGGGSIFHGLVLYDTLRTLAAKGHIITTVCRGYTASMAGLLFMAGDVRVMGAESQVMIHSLSSITAGNLHELEDDIEFFKKLQKRLNAIYVSRSKITKSMIESKTRKTDWWLPAEECVELGVATSIG